VKSWRTAYLLKCFSLAMLFAMLVAGMCAGWIAPHHFADQDRDHPNVAPSRQFLLGTDDLGRDRFSRLLYGTRVSLLLAPAAALISVVIGLAVGAFTAYAPPLVQRLCSGVTDLLLALPTILILLTARAMLPLNVSAWTSIVITCGLMGTLSWPAAARIIQAGTSSLIRADFILQARAAGQSTRRILMKQVAPNLRAVLIAQFWILVPVFILTEANLSLLGLGVCEPLPSWGNMLRELENYAAIPERPWVLAPLAILMTTILSLYAVLPAGDEA
jgi:peptide/nickel transport system permease protein